MKTFSIGMGQMLVEGGRPEDNLDRAERMIEEAGRRGCYFLVLPECLDLGWTHPSARDLAQPLPGPYSDRLAAAARRAGVYVVAGLVERDGDRLYNAAVLISPEGELLLKHRKINELDIAHDLYSIGDRLGVADTPFGRVGVTICADNFPGTLAFGESLARMGARLLLSPCAWAVDADHDNGKEPYGGLWKGAYSTLARKFPVTVVGVSNVGWMTGGPWEGRKCIGCSLAVGPGGEVLAEGPYGESAEALLQFIVEGEH
jgi:predicted amidohydrolase